MAGEKNYAGQHLEFFLELTLTHCQHFASCQQVVNYLSLCQLFWFTSSLIPFHAFILIIHPCRCVNIDAIFLDELWQLANRDHPCKSHALIVHFAISLPFNRIPDFPMLYEFISFLHASYFPIYTAFDSDLDAQTSSSTCAFTVLLPPRLRHS